MSLTANLNYAQLDGVQAVELPYVGQELSMVVLVPDAGTFETFASDLVADELTALLDALQPASVRLDLPQFSYASGFQLPCPRIPQQQLFSGEPVHLVIGPAGCQKSAVGRNRGRIGCVRMNQRQVGDFPFGGNVPDDGRPQR